VDDAVSGGVCLTLNEGLNAEISAWYHKKNMAQIPINFGDQDYDPSFLLGFGLTWDD